MNFLQKIRTYKKVTRYTMNKLIKELGVHLTIGAITHYEEQNAQRMRLPVLCAIRKISGLGWGVFGKQLDKEFLPKIKKKRNKPPTMKELDEIEPIKKVSVD